MILPLRGAPVDTNRRAELRAALNPQEVVQRIDKLIDREEVRLTKIFSDDDVHQVCDELEIEFREREFTPAITLGLFVAQHLSRGDACSTVVTKFNRERKRQGQLPYNEDTSAYCKARAKLSVELIDRLGKNIVDLLRTKAKSQWKWHGLNVYLVDGLVFRAPDTQANQEAYPQPSTQKEGLGFPQIHCVVTTCLTTGCVVNYNSAAMKGKLTGKVSLLREKHGDFMSGDVVIADSNFESFYDAVLLNRRGVELVCGIKGCRNSPFEGVCEVLNEKIITLTKPKNNRNRFTAEQWQQLPESIQYRCIRYRIAGRSEVLTIATTLIGSNDFQLKTSQNYTV